MKNSGVLTYEKCSEVRNCDFGEIISFFFGWNFGDMAVRYSRLPTDEPQMETDLPSLILPDNHGELYKSTIDYNTVFTYAKYNSLNEGRYFSYNGRQKFRFNSDRRNIVRDNVHGSGTGSTIAEMLLIAVCYLIFAITVPFSLILCLKFIQRFEKLIIFRVGRIQKPRGPGAVVVLPCIDSWQKVDMRMKAFNVPPVQSVTRDVGVVELGASVQYHIKDPTACVVSVQDWNLATRTLAHTMLHRHLNKKCMSDIVGELKTFQAELLEELNQSTLSWGMEITEVKLSDIKTIKKAEEPTQNLIKNLSNPQVASQIFRSLTTCTDYMQLQETLTKTITSAAKPVPFQPEDLKPVDGPLIPEGSGIPVDNMSLDIEKLINTLSSICTEELVSEIGYVYQINCLGCGEFYMDLKNGAGWVESGNVPSTISKDITIELNSKDLMALILGLISPWDAYNSGRVKVEGNVYAATKLQVLAKSLSQKIANS